MDAVTPVTMKPPWALVFLSAIAPLLLLAGLIWWFFHGGSELIDRPVPPIEQISIRRVELKPGEFKLTIRNTGPMPVDLTLVTVDEAIWKAEFSPSRHLERLEEATVRIPFDWVAGDPYKIELFTANGLAFEKEIAVAIETPRTSARMFLIFAAMGLYVGILPVAFGILWLPFLRRLGTRWINFFLSFTVGLLVFLGLDALHEGFEVASQLPGVFSGIGLLGIGFMLAFLLITGLDRFLRARTEPAGRRVSVDSGLHDCLRDRHSQLGRGSGDWECLRGWRNRARSALAGGLYRTQYDRGFGHRLPTGALQAKADSSCLAWPRRGSAGDSRLLDGRLHLLRRRVCSFSRGRCRCGLPSRLVDRDADGEDRRGQSLSLGQRGGISARHDRDVGHGTTRLKLRRSWN